MASFMNKPGPTHTFRVIAYKGIGRIPKDLHKKSDPRKRILLDRLPKILAGYGNTFANNSFPTAVIVVCDLDDRCLKAFRQELDAIAEAPRKRVRVKFCIAIEEGEAWFLGDMAAIYRAYPNAKASVLGRYANDSICGTWELLADAVVTGGAKALKKRGWVAIGTEKSLWAERISPEMDLENNASPSFNYFRFKILELCE